MIDHLVYATANLADSVDELNSRFGVALTPGGRHVRFGTRNFLADLGDGRYLEVIGPDPEQPTPDSPRPFSIDNLTRPRLVTWAARVKNLDEAVRRAQTAGCDPGPIIAMSRDSPDGAGLRWRMALPPTAGELGGLVPLLMDWADAAHPSQTAAPGMRLLSLTGFHPDVARIQQCLTALGEELDIQKRPEPGLRAVLATPAGEVDLQ